MGGIFLAKFCASCGSKVSLGDKFCGKCGFNLLQHKNELKSEIPSKTFCPNCGEEIISSDKFCCNCDFNLLQRQTELQKENFSTPPKKYSPPQDFKTETPKTTPPPREFTSEDYPPDVYVPDRGIWQKFFKISGRLNPMRFLFRATIILTLEILFSILLFVLDIQIIKDQSMHTLIATAWLPIIPLIPLAIRRAHDLGRPGWYCIVACIPIIAGFFELWFKKVWWHDRHDNYHEKYIFNDMGVIMSGIYLIIVGLFAVVFFTLCPGNKGTNQYGANPAGETADIPVENNFILGIISKIEEHEYSTIAIIASVVLLNFVPPTVTNFINNAYSVQNSSKPNSTNLVEVQKQLPQNNAVDSQVQKNQPEKPPQTSQNQNNLLVSPLTSENQKAAVDTLVSFHKNITQKNFRSAYNCLSYEFQNSMDYYGWADGFATTVSSAVDNISIVSENAYEINLNYVLTAIDNIGGRQQTAKFNGTATIINENGNWKIDYIKNKVL